MTHVMKSTLFIFIFTILSCTCVDLPKHFKKCDRKQKDFNECLATAITDSIEKLTAPMKEVGLVSFQPLHVPSLVIGAGTGAVAFKQNYNNLKLSGLTKTKFSKAEMNFEKKTMRMEGSVEQIKMEFDYEINGKILLLPIYGKGPGSIILDNVKVVLTFTFEEYDKKGQKHFKIVDKKMDLVPSLLKFKLDNLFDGDKALGDNINQVMNDNWAEVYADVKSSYEEAFSQIFSGIFSNLLGKVSVSELFGDA